MADTKTVDVRAVLRRLCANVEFASLKREGQEAIGVIDELIGVADEAYAELLADSHRDGPRCSLLTRLEAALRAVGGAE
jgi:hypothetical protein